MIYLLSKGALFQFQDAEIRVPESNGIAEILIENAGNTNVSATLRYELSKRIEKFL